VSDAELAPEEDAELRRLHKLRGFGMVAGSISSRYEALRGRDRRKKVREPSDATLAVPTERSLWGENVKSPRPTAEAEPSAPAPTQAATGPAEPLVAVPASGAERVISDTREVFGELPQSRRGFGIFRR
jgi:hypothetical protein